MTFSDLVLTLLMIALTAYTCRTCQFPVYLQSSAAESARRRDWRARSRSSRVALTSLRVVVDGGNLSWYDLERDTRSDDVIPIYVDHCLEEINHVAGLYIKCATSKLERSLH